MHRIIFTLKMLWRYRKPLNTYYQDLSLQTETIFQTPLQQLKKTGTEVLVLDYDGVLAGYAVDTLEPRVKDWLTRAVDIFGANNIFILSNRPVLARQNYFAEHFPGIIFVKASRKKPYPDGLLSILTQKTIEPKALLFIDDRLLTGILAAIIAETRALWVTSPVVNFRKHPVPEIGFIILRKLDRLLIWGVNAISRLG